CCFFFQAEDGIRDLIVTGVQTCALPIYCGPSGYGFKLVASVMNFFISLFKFGIEPPPIYPDYPHCNLLGLSSLGQELVTEMMNKGMIIDVDHMSLKTLDRVLELAEARSYPVVASHVLFYD